MKNVEDIFPVSPMQEMMLLHTQARRQNDTLFNQFCFGIDATLDVPAFEYAWHQIVNRHAALRTSFIWEKLKQPLQVVRQKLDLSFYKCDWRDREQLEQSQLFTRFCENDRKKGFTLTSAPLMRFALMQCDEDAWYFVWSSHHLIIDRWSLNTVFEDLNQFYAANCAAHMPSLQPAQSFRHYIDWILKQNPDASKLYWRNALRGFNGANRIATDPAGSTQSDRLLNDSHQIEVPGDVYDTLRTFARQHEITISTVLQGAWALTLNHFTQAQDIIFGVVVSGRPPDLPGVESIVGSFINNLPVRVRLPANEAINVWLKNLQEEQQNRRGYEYVSPAEIQRLSELPDSQPLFDSLLVWLSPQNSNQLDRLPMRALSTDFSTIYPVTLSVVETNDSLTLHAQTNTRNGRATRTSEILSHLHATLVAILATDAHGPLSQFGGFCHESESRFESAGHIHGTASPTADSHHLATCTENASPLRGDVHDDVINELLFALWRSVLGQNDIELDDDFFDLGGNSIQAAHLHASLESAIRKTVPILELFQAPTIRKMATMVREGQWPIKPGSVIPVRTHGRGLPLFFIATPEFNTLGYSILVRHLDWRQNVYVLQSPPNSTNFQRLKPAEVLAFTRQYIDALRTVQPKGPYHLVGMCEGAHLSVEMARQLHAENETVNFLGIIDTWGFYTLSRLQYLNQFVDRFRWYMHRVRDVLSLKTTKQPSPNHITGSIASLNERTRNDLVYVERGDPWVEEVGWPDKDPMRSKIPGPITVFRLKPQAYWRVRDTGLGWSKQAEHVNIIRLPGTDHNSILREPFVQALAREIGKCLNELEGEPTADKEMP